MIVYVLMQYLLVLELTKRVVHPLFICLSITGLQFRLYYESFAWYLKARSMTTFPTGSITLITVMLVICDSQLKFKDLIQKQRHLMHFQPPTVCTEFHHTDTKTNFNVGTLSRFTLTTTCESKLTGNPHL